jgi:hypothetical protein
MAAVLQVRVVRAFKHFSRKISIAIKTFCSQTKFLPVELRSHEAGRHLTESYLKLLGSPKKVFFLKKS